MLIEFPATSTLTVAQALDSAKQADLSDVLICGYDNQGCLFVRSSRMDRKDALWIAEQLKIYAMNIHQGEDQ